MNNLLNVTDVKIIINSDISTQEKIRLLFRLGYTRSEIAKTLGVKYQVVFKACNPKYAPKRWQRVLSTMLDRERSTKVEDIEEVELFEEDGETEEVTN